MSTRVIPLDTVIGIARGFGSDRGILDPQCLKEPREDIRPGRDFCQIGQGGNHILVSHVLVAALLRRLAQDRERVPDRIAARHLVVPNGLFGSELGREHNENS